MLIVDAHEDLAWNMLQFGRDYTRSAVETRRLEAGGLAPSVNGDTLLGWPEWQRGQVGVIFATLFAAPARWREGEWETIIYNSTLEANRLYGAQLDLYHRLVDEHPDKFRLIKTRRQLAETVAAWQAPLEPAAPPAENPIGLVILMEGAEGVRAPAELEEWWARGVRLIGPAWSGTRFCGGTREPGALTKEGQALLESMADLGFVLDISHMDEPAALQALEMYPGTVVASHANPLALLKGTDSNRHLSDRVLRSLIERGGMAGVVIYNLFLQANWVKGDPREKVGLGRLVEAIDYVCQVAGDAQHVGIGSDFDGGFGLQSVPPGIDSIADLQKLIPLLAEKGYNQADIAAILGGNWTERLEKALPESA